MVGIYLHIPFCKQACHYCNFHFSTTLKNYESTVAAICWEIEYRKDYLPTKQIDTIYFGGGTPSILKRLDLEKVLAIIHKNYSVNASAEITLEANPDDIDKDNLTSWKKYATLLENRRRSSPPWQKQTRRMSVQVGWIHANTTRILRISTPP